MKSNRPRKIPVVLQLVRVLVKNRDPFEPLFKTPYTKSGFHTRRWLEEAMARLCKAAGVPYVCPHAEALRRGGCSASSGWSVPSPRSPAGSGPDTGALRTFRV